MLKKNIFWLGLILLSIAGCSEKKTTNEISGNVVNGYREISLLNELTDLSFTVYRGDYIKFIIQGQKGKQTLTITDLNIAKEINYDAKNLAYTKMKKAGEYAFSLGKYSGKIKVIDFVKSNYNELSAAAAKELIRTKEVLILDVRTPNEFHRSHIKGAQLLPVQSVQRNLEQLNKFKNKDILIYCATGNRSTVASKILLDNGFTSIYNMRYGISDWARKGNEVVK